MYPYKYFIFMSAENASRAIYPMSISIPTTHSLVKVTFNKIPFSIKGTRTLEERAHFKAWVGQLQDEHLAASEIRKCSQSGSAIANGCWGQWNELKNDQIQNNLSSK